MKGEVLPALSAIATAARLAPSNAVIAQKYGQYLADQSSPVAVTELLRAKKLDPSLPDVDFEIGLAAILPGLAALARKFHRELGNRPPSVA